MSKRAAIALAAVAFTLSLAAPADPMTSALTPSAAAAVGGSIGLRLVDAPLAARDDPRARIYIVDRMAPGSLIHRRIAVTNTTASPAYVLLYASAASLARGAFFGADGHTVNELSSWTSVQPGTVTVPANGQALTMVSLAVPRDASPGERYGVVWAQVSSAARPGGGVVQVSRVGIRMYVSVGPGGAPASDFAIASLTAERGADGRPTVVATVRNTGERALDMSGSLRLSAGPGGLGAGPFPAVLGTTLAIGDTEPVTIVLDREVPAGPWNVAITLRSALVEHRATATLTFPDAGAARPVAVRPDYGRRSLMPLFVGLVGVVVVALAVGAAILRRRGRRRHAPRWKGPKHAATSPA